MIFTSFAKFYVSVDMVLRGESSKHPARNTKDMEHIKSTQTTANRPNSQTKHQEPSKGQPKSRITPTITAAMHASITATSCYHYTHVAGSSPHPLSRRSPMRSVGGLSRTKLQTPPKPAGTCRAPRLGARYKEELMDSQERTASRRGGERGNGWRGG